MAEKIEDKIKKALEKIRPSMQADGGDVEFVSWDGKTGVVEVRFQGMCVGCPMAQMTLKNGIEKAVMEEVPEVKEVVAV
ncbi:NifU family protein [Candidatus Falkowbacteria bacterium]|nr:MAG: NifU family protein [Candidatus Falkowbacteria bacterium]